jgi:hypothetical protein
MSSRTAVFVLALAAVAALAAGCHKPRPPAVSGQGGGASGGAVIVGAADLPHPHPGEWAITDESQGQGFHNTVCVTDRPFNVGKVTAFCQSFVYRRTLGGGLTVDARCGKGPVSSSLHMTAQGDFNSAYSTDTEMSFTLRPGAAPHVTRTHMDYRYLGPCPAAEQAAAERAGRGE